MLVRRRPCRLLSGYSPPKAASARQFQAVGSGPSMAIGNHLPSFCLRSSKWTRWLSKWWPFWAVATSIVAGASKMGATAAISYHWLPSSPRFRVLVRSCLIAALRCNGRSFGPADSCLEFLSSWPSPEFVCCSFREPPCWPSFVGT